MKECKKEEEVTADIYAKVKMILQIITQPLIFT